MSPASADRNLLFGVIALQMDLVSRDQLVAAMNAWAIDKAKPLGQILVDHHALDPAVRSMLEPLVDHHVARHGGDPAASLAAIGSATSARDALAAVDDPDVQRSLDGLRPPRDPSRTVTFAGAPTAPGARFRILRPHAKGGLGIVSVALDQELDRPVAFKEIQDKYADHADSRARFVIEAEVTGKLEHPGVVPVYGLGHHADGRPFYAMRFVEGDSLKDALKRFHGPDGPKDATARTLALRELLGRFLDVCNAIAYAHSRGVLHRDLKPGNIMLGPFGETLVVDWGLAKVLDRAEPGPGNGAGPVRLTLPSGSRDATLAGAAVGTPAYMSPEQAAGRLDLLGPASDVYGLGAVLYHLLTGHLPVECSDTGEALRRVRRGEVPAPRSHDRRVPRALEAVCLKAIAVDPAARYATARDLAADVKRWLADEPVSARRDPLLTRAWRWVRKHRTLATAAAAVLLVGSIGLAVAWRREAALGTDLAGALGRERAANGQLVAANERVTAAKGVADRRLDETLGAVKDYYTGVGEEVLLEQPQLKGLRDRLLAKPRQFYADLAAELAASGADDARSRELLARARFELGNVLQKVGEPGQALAEYAAAAAAYERLAADQPGVPDYREGLANSYTNLGTAQDVTGAPAEAIASYGKAIAHFERLAADQPGVPGYRDGLANSYTNLGLAQQATGAPADAIASHAKAIALRERLAADQPGVPDYRDGLAKSYNNLGAAQRATGAPAEAIASYGKAIAHFERLAADQPGVPGYRDGLANSYGNLGTAQRATGAPAEAIASYGKAIAHFERLAADQPGVPGYRDGLANSYTNLGLAQQATGAPADAIASHAKAIALRERLAADQPGVPDYRDGLAGSYFNLGAVQQATGAPADAIASYAKAIALRERLAADQPGVPEYHDVLARSYTNLGVAQLATGATAEAIASHGKAIAVLRPLVAAHPQALGYQHTLGGSLGNLGLALLHAGQARPAESALREGASVEEGVFRRAPNNPEVRQFLSNKYRVLAAALRAQRRGAEAAAVTRQRRGLWPGVAGEQYNMACELALSMPIVDEAERDAMGAEAMEALREAVISGWSDAVHTAHDADLTPLRGRADFGRVVVGMFDRKFPADPFVGRE